MLDPGTKSLDLDNYNEFFSVIFDYISLEILIVAEVSVHISRGDIQVTTVTNAFILCEAALAVSDSGEGHPVSTGRRWQ